MLTASLSNAFTQSSAIQCCLKGADKGTSAIVSYVSGNNLVPTDTVALDKKGNFKTQVNVSEPTLFIINFFGIERNTMHVMLEPKENVTLEMEYIPSLQFIHITESEALQLHALMMCSNPSVMLLKPNTLRIINTLYEFRRETDIPVCFTLDAGPNVHLLYPDQHAEMVERFIMDELEPYCHEGQWIADQVGDGPSRC